EPLLLGALLEAVGHLVVTGPGPERQLDRLGLAGGDLDEVVAPVELLARVRTLLDDGGGDRRGLRPLPVRPPGARGVPPGRVGEGRGGLPALGGGLGGGKGRGRRGGRGRRRRARGGRRQQRDG